MRPTLRGAGNPERDGRGSSHERASDTAESAGTGGSTETAMVMAGHFFHWRSIRSGAGRGGSVDDTGRVPFPHTFLSFDLWLIALFFDDSPVNSTTFRNRLRDAKKAAAEMEVDGKVVIERDTIDHKRGVKAWRILQVRQQKNLGSKS